ncbi:hypothetical protein D3C73_1266930 [compost metagenome]
MGRESVGQIGPTFKPGLYGARFVLDVEILAQAAQRRGAQVPGQLLFAVDPAGVSGNDVKPQGRNGDEHVERLHFPGRKCRQAGPRKGRSNKHP